MRSRQTTASVRHRDERRPYSAKPILSPASVAGGFQRGAHIPLWRAFFAALPRFFPTRERNGVTDLTCVAQRGGTPLISRLTATPSPQGEGFGCVTSLATYHAPQRIRRVPHNPQPKKVLTTRFRWSGLLRSALNFNGLRLDVRVVRTENRLAVRIGFHFPEPLQGLPLQMTVKAKSGNDQIVNVAV